MPFKRHTSRTKGECSSSDSPALTARSGREIDNHYIHLVAQLNPKHRVVRCKDNIQWIIQRRDGRNKHGQKWKNVKYCVLPETLLRLCLTQCGICDAAALDIIKNLQFERKESVYDHSLIAANAAYSGD